MTGRSALLFLLLVATASAATMDKKTVSVKLFYEADCPDCRIFFKDQLGPLWKEDKEGVLAIDLYPYGNARQWYNSTTKAWDFKCQHGGEECRGNLLEACTINAFKFRPALYMPAVICMESGFGRADKAAKDCLGKMFDDIDKCARGPVGNALLHTFGAATEALNPAHTFVPWVVIDGKSDMDTQNAADKDLKGVVCKIMPSADFCKEASFDWMGAIKLEVVQ